MKVACFCVLFGGVAAIRATDSVLLNLKPPTEDVTASKALLQTLFQDLQSSTDSNTQQFRAVLSKFTTNGGKVSFIQRDQLESHIQSLSNRVSHGGSSTEAALTELLSLANESGARTMMNNAGALRRAAAIMQSESAPSSAKGAMFV